MFFFFSFRKRPLRRLLLSWIDIKRQIQRPLTSTAVLYGTIVLLSVVQASQPCPLIPSLRARIFTTTQPRRVPPCADNSYPLLAKNADKFFFSLVQLATIVVAVTSWGRGVLGLSKLSRISLCRTQRTKPWTPSSSFESLRSTPKNKPNSCASSSLDGPRLQV